MAKKKTKKVKETSRQTYSIEIIHYDDHTYRMNRVCDGFTPIELIGILEFTQREIIEQIAGKFKPDVVKRTYIKD